MYGKTILRGAFSLAVAALVVGALVGGIFAMDAAHQIAGAGGMSVAMAVVTKYAGSAKDPALSALVPAVLGEGRMRAISVPALAITNGDDINSKFYLGKIPSNAVPITGFTSLKHGGVTSAADVDIGIYKDGAVVDIDLFADGITLAAAGTKDPFASIAVADVGKQVWQLLGLSIDPGVEYDVVLTLKAAATATASIGGHILYAKK